jgi:hypothetical protein
MAPILFPDASEHAAARMRLAKRFRPLLNSSNPKHRDVGFFLFGLAEALGRARRPSKREVGNA